jgi:hypothetical protein
MAVFLETARLRLRDFVLEDGAFISRMNGDPEVMTYLGGPMTDPQESFDWVERRPPGFWMAEVLATGEPIGWFHLRPERQEPFELELGYRLVRSAWGQGFATEASLGLLAVARERGAPRVVATTDVLNLGSRRVMAKVGMRHTADFLYDGKWSSVRYEIELG